MSLPAFRSNVHISAWQLCTACLALICMSVLGCSRGERYPRENTWSAELAPFDDSPICLRHGVRTRSRIKFVVGFDFYRDSYGWECPEGHHTPDGSVVGPALHHLRRQGFESVRWFGESEELDWYSGPVDYQLPWFLVQPTVVVLAINPSVVAVVDAPTRWSEDFQAGRVVNTWRERELVWLEQGVIDGTRLPIQSVDAEWLKSIKIAVVGREGLAAIDASTPGHLEHAGVSVRWSHLPTTDGPDYWLEFSVSKLPRD